MALDQDQQVAMPAWRANLSEVPWELRALKQKEVYQQEQEQQWENTLGPRKKNPRRQRQQHLVLLLQVLLQLELLHLRPIRPSFHRYLQWWIHSMERPE